jgi:AcrR family transcriptional regulator
VRSDVRRNRRLLLDAARELFATTPQVPLYEVARRAGVGQATLYRHFPDRGAMADALMQEEFDRLHAAISGREDDPDSFAALLVEMVDIKVRLHRLAYVMHEGPNGEAAFARLRAQTAAIFARPLAAAQAAGVVRADLTTEDLLLIPRMLDGVLYHVEDATSRSEAALRWLRLLSLGYSAR